MVSLTTGTSSADADPLPNGCPPYPAPGLIRLQAERRKVRDSCIRGGWLPPSGKQGGKELSRVSFPSNLSAPPPTPLAAGGFFSSGDLGYASSADVIGAAVSGYGHGQHLLAPGFAPGMPHLGFPAMPTSPTPENLNSQQPHRWSRA